MKYSDYILYFGLLILFLFAVKEEYRDLYCSNGECNEGLGQPYNTPYCQVEKDDDATTLKEKHEKCANVIRKTVYWRRSLIIATVTIIISWLVLFQKFPNSTELITMVFIVGGLIYYSFNFYNFHYIDYIVQRLNNLNSAL